MGLRRFSDNPAASTPLTGSEVIPGIQTGADVAMTAQDIADLAGAGAGGAQVVELSGTAYDLGDLTSGAWHVFTSSTAVTLLAEASSVTPIEVRTEFGLECRGSGGITITEDTGVTVIPPKGGALVMEEADFTVLKCTDTDEYKLVGSTVAA